MTPTLSARLRELLEQPIFPDNGSVSLSDYERLEKLALLLPECVEQLQSQYYYDLSCTACDDNKTNKAELLAKIERAVEEMG